jgi:hypothetical protein
MLLNGWKEISNHLQRGVRTVQRWERLGLPIMRITKGVRSPVIARTEDLDQWLTRQENKSDPQPLTLAEFAETRRAKLHEQADALRRRSAALIQAAEQITVRGLKLRA